MRLKLGTISSNTDIFLRLFLHFHKFRQRMLRSFARFTENNDAFTGRISEEEQRYIQIYFCTKSQFYDKIGVYKRVPAGTVFFLAVRPVFMNPGIHV